MKIWYAITVVKIILNKIFYLLLLMSNLVVAVAVTIAIIIIVVISRYLFVSSSSGQTLQAKKPKKASSHPECQACLSLYPNDTRSLCNCLKASECEQTAQYCDLPGVRSDCDKCNIEYGKCLDKTNDYEQCSKAQCACYTAAKCDQALIDASCYVQPTPSGVISSCVPDDGVWDDPDTGKLKGPCCVPPDYQLAQNYKTCVNISEETDPTISKCLNQCCKYVNNTAPFMDPTYTPLAYCGCSLCCYNQGQNHFQKFGNCQQYLEQGKADIDVPDSLNPVSNGDWRGWV